MKEGGTKVEQPWVYRRSEIIPRETKENKRDKGIPMGKRRNGEWRDGRETTIF